MDRKYAGYYRKPSKVGLNSLFREATIVFDSNIWLSLYHYQENTADTWLQVLSDVKDKIWCPHQIAFEYHKNKEAQIGIHSGSKIANLKAAISSILPHSFEKEIETFEKFAKESACISEELRLTVSEKYKQLAFDINKSKNSADSETLKTLEDCVNTYLKRCETIESKVVEILSGRVGDPYEVEEFSKRCTWAEQRYLQQIPPGFSDAAKTENKFGDALIWFQLLDFGKATGKPIVFVTKDSTKADWFYLKHDGKTLGPRAELIEEMQRFAKVDFHAYKGETFLKVVKAQGTELSIPNEAIRETKALDPISSAKFQPPIFWNQVSSNTWTNNTRTLYGLPPIVKTFYLERQNFSTWILMYEPLYPPIIGLQPRVIFHSTTDLYTTLKKIGFSPSQMEQLLILGAIDYQFPDSSNDTNQSTAY